MLSPFPFRPWVAKVNVLLSARSIVIPEENALGLSRYSPFPFSPPCSLHFVFAISLLFFLLVPLSESPFPLFVVAPPSPSRSRSLSCFIVFGLSLDSSSTLITSIAVPRVPGSVCPVPLSSNPSFVPFLVQRKMTLPSSSSASVVSSGPSSSSWVLRLALSSSREQTYSPSPAM